MYIIDVPEHLQRSESVEHHLWIVVCRSFNAFAIFEIDYLKTITRDDAAVTGAEAVGYETGHNLGEHGRFMSVLSDIFDCF